MFFDFFFFNFMELNAIEKFNRNQLLDKTRRPVTEYKKVVMLICDDDGGCGNTLFCFSFRTSVSWRSGPRDPVFERSWWHDKERRRSDLSPVSKPLTCLARVTNRLTILPDRQAGSLSLVSFRSHGERHMQGTVRLHTHEHQHVLTLTVAFFFS